eukprot:TRINITY_DN15069_c0_g1_i1.p1 TRINITY_DN15069_c0_g1~~TRINITY_DN15069_c0_g1_i1.p1  ORF type:complete len:401 (+),score=103.54 TRINITY_DN15069_c0_g1_i1:205-1407(+)
MTTEREKKLVVLGIPWDVDTDGLEDYMSKFGEIDDVIVLKDRATGRSRGFGYVTFSSVEDAKKALEAEHVLNGRSLEVKVATPKEEMKAPSKKITRIFVARIPSSVTEDTFRKYFEEYGKIEDLYMPKEKGSGGHRGIGFITFEKSESVDKLMSETHVLGGATIAIDRATPKEENLKPWGRPMSSGYGAYDDYINAATRYGRLGPSTLYERSSAGFRDGYGSGLGGAYGGMGSWPAYGSSSSYGISERFAGYGHGGYSGPSRAMLKRIFVGRLPHEAKAEDLRRYFSKFGTVSDVFVPKNPKNNGNKGFGFVSFVESGVAERVMRRSHEILGQEVAVDSAAPPDDDRLADDFIPPVGFGGRLRDPASYSVGSYDWGYGSSGIGPSSSSRSSRMDFRYRPY